MPGWLRLPLIGAAAVALFVVAGYMVFGPKDTKPVGTGGPEWSPGKAMPPQKPVANQTAAASQEQKTTQQSAVPGPKVAAISNGPPLLVTWGTAPPASPVSAVQKASLKSAENDDAPDGIEAKVYKDTSWLLKKNTMFSCLMPQPVDTQMGGAVTCFVDQKGGVMSDTGSNILLDEGAQINGTVVTGSQYGQARVGIIWTDFKSGRVNGSLGDSPATDGLGQTGVPGVADNHWWDLIKSAVLFTAVDTAGQVVNNLTQKEGTASVNFSQGQSMAQNAMQSQYGQVRRTVGIPGVGTEVMVQVKQNIWFKKAYNDTLVAGVK